MGQKDEVDGRRREVVESYSVNAAKVIDIFPIVLDAGQSRGQSDPEVKAHVARAFVALQVTGTLAADFRSEPLHIYGKSRRVGGGSWRPTRWER